LDQLGLLNRLISYAADIDFGRRGFDIDGQEHEGHLSYTRGISGALEAFKEVQTAKDPQTLILAEIVFLQQEFQFCSKADTDAKNSLTQAIQCFNDALRSLEAVHDAGYKIAEKTYPLSPKYRYHAMPKDAFHIACISHRTRIQNILRVPGMNMTEKAVYQQRFGNMTTAQNSYSGLQQTALI
jgi:hypothetical protein